MLTLALIGIGNWGKNFISTVKSIPDCQIKYVCSQTSEKLNLLGNSFIKTTDYKDLFNCSDIDGVIIATNGSSHFKIAKDFLEKEFNVLIEKPLTLSYKEALELEALKQNQSKVLVGHTYLFDPAFIKAKELIKDLGNIEYLFYEGVSNGPFRADISTLWDMGPHPISLFLDICQKTPIQISAWAESRLRPKSDLYDLVLIRLKFSDGFSGYIKIGSLFPFKRRELVIVGSNDTLVYSDLMDKKLTLYKDMGPKIEGVNLIKRDSGISYPQYPSILPLEMELKEFIGAVKDNREVKISDLKFGVFVTKLLDLAQQSIKNNGEIVDIN